MDDTSQGRDVVSLRYILSAEGHADGFIASSEATTFETVLRKVWDLDAVGEALYDGSQTGKSVLENIRVIA